MRNAISRPGGDPGIIITPAILLKGKNEELFHAVGMAEKRLCVVKLEIIASRRKTYGFGSLAARKLCVIDTIRLELNILSISDFTAVLCEFIRFN